MRSPFRGPVIVGLVLAGALACHSDEVVAPGGELGLVLVSGDSQSVTPLAISAPIVVRVVDGADLPVAGAVVRFAVDSGAGAMTVAVDTSDVDGLVASTYQANTRAGRRRLSARLATAQLRFHLAVTHGTAVGNNFNIYGWRQRAPAGSVLPEPLGLRVRDAWDNGVPGQKIAWRVRTGGGTVSSDTTVTDADGRAEVIRTLGPGGGGQLTNAIVVALDDTVVFHSTANGAMTVLGGGNNVAGRCSGRIWAHGDYAYSATWSLDGACPHAGNGLATRVYVWDVRGAAPQVVDSLEIPGGDVSDLEVSADGTLLLATVQLTSDGNDGLYLYSLTTPAHPVLLDTQVDNDEPTTPTGPLRAATFADIAGQRYVFASRGPTLDPSALVVFRIEALATDKIVPVAEKVPDGHAVVDQVVRDGVLFASVGSGGVGIYDVGGGPAGGTPEQPFRLLMVSANSGLSSMAAALYDHPTRPKRYLFDVQRRGGGSVPGWIRVLDVIDPMDPFTATTIPGESPEVRTLWVDEARGILYVAYVGGAVVAYDVLGQLVGTEMSDREIARISPTGGAIDVWGMASSNGALWVSDMVSGLWKVAVP